MYRLVLGLVAGAVAVATALFVKSLIDKKAVKKKVRDDGKIYALIQEKQRNTLKIKEIDEYGNSEDVVMKSDEGIADDVRVGERIYAY